MTDSSPAQQYCSEGMALLQLRDHLMEAELAFRAGLGADPDHAGCTLQLGITLRVLGRFKESFVLLERARCLCPDDPMVHLHMGTLFLAQKKLEYALASYDAALALKPDHAYTRYKRARALQEMSRWNEARCQYERLMTELPPEVIAEYDLKRLRSEVNDRMAFMERYGVDATLPSDQMAVALYRRANQLVIEGNLNDAVRIYEESSLLLPDYTNPEFHIGETVAIQMARHPSGEYLSCRWIEEALHFHEYKLGFCCTQHSGGKGWATVGTYHGGPVPIDFVMARRHQIIQENQVGVDNQCKGCHVLERRSWELKPTVLSVLVINSYSVCNMKCTYCSLAIADFKMAAYYYMAGPAIDSLMANGWLEPGAYVAWGGGEPSVSVEFGPITSKLLALGCHLNIHTNATRLLPILLDALREGRCDMVISVDSGTPETFYKTKYMSDHPILIQGRPAFNVVWDCIAQYSAASSDSVIVKYIFTSERVGDADISGFIDLCLAHGITRVMLTPEATDVTGGEVPQEVWHAVNKAKALAHANGLLVLFNPLDPNTANMPKDLRESLVFLDQDRAFLVDGTCEPVSVSGLQDYTKLWRIAISPPP